MVVEIIGIVIGVLILGAGIYYLRKDGHDAESKKIYGITSGVGAAVTIISAIILASHL